MASVAPSDTESNCGFIRYSDKNFKHLYTSLIQLRAAESSASYVNSIQEKHASIPVIPLTICQQNMEIINQDILQIEKNLTSIVAQSGPMEGQLSVLLQTLPKPTTTVSMETE